ncbi:hypothetical protein A1O3_05475 [Capronia epimyces CBS 606.96]|uniref:Heterokaryon incompatibility domain-containing protein n=1 Tax=Capronia epimyces CBS 606.96 TaxID=1182542 RepID=W9XX40_9EURO|nr:uncharacterized protein A1O3_05475 [Capronia epimyces CBS 606.96]EXJ84803.1 hypothetical protein A1O3_05475 [Capronia epimyces CBS 606.96]
MSLRPSRFAFSEDRLKAIWRDPENFQRKSVYEWHQIVDHDSEHGLPDQRAARRLCLQFSKDVEDPKFSLARLDASYSATWRPPNLGRAVDIEGQVLGRAIEILGQQPATPPTILDALPFGTVSENHYVLPLNGAEHHAEVVSDLAWDNLLVVNFVDTIVLRLVLCIAQSQLTRQYGPASIVRLLNATIQLLRTSLDLASEQGAKDQKWIIVCAFLWTSWSRILLLRLGAAVGRQLQGFDYNMRGLNSIRFLDVVPEVVECRRRILDRELKATPYLCAWAYRNLTEDRASISTDLRRFHQVYHACFGTKLAICNSGSKQCSGVSSIVCGRFEQTPVTNQSSHAPGCRGDCDRLFWIRESFIAVSGPKAVDITATDATGLRYCESTEKTLTISHVWSHGQGGRPNRGGAEGTGFNSCLHRRYSKLALSMGCSSYWMDTAAIPSEPDLRWDCIANITRIFSTSETTLVCDRDIMTIDISDPCPETCEQLLAALLVCDWNMRAWTLLEAMRGRHSLVLLCRDDKVISVRETLETVYARGRVDMVIPFMMRSYLLPPDDITDMELFEGGGSVATEEDQQIAQGFVSIGEAAALLSHRHATRDDDDLLIWNLLAGDVETSDPTQMWRRLVGKRISTGALVSSAPRLRGVPGFHWAPSRPTMPRRTTGSSSHEKTFPASDGVDMKDGHITAEGLRARWLAFKFDVPARGLQSDDLGLGEGSLENKLAEIARRHLDHLPKGIMLQACPARGPANVPIPYQGSINPLLVVCASEDGIRWEWKGIYEWDRHVQLPPFALEEILLV